MSISKGDTVEEKTSGLQGTVTKVMEDDGGKKLRIEWNGGSVDQGVRRPHEVRKV